MKVIIKKEHEEKRFIHYPCLMVSNDGNVVLFHAPKCGICLESDDSAFKPGHYSKTWLMERFRPFQGTLTIVS